MPFLWTANFTFTLHTFTKKIFRPRDKLSFGHREAREGDLTSGDYRFKNSKTFNVQPTFGESLPLSRLSKIQLIDLSLLTAYFKRKCKTTSLLVSIASIGLFVEL